MINRRALTLGGLAGLATVAARADDKPPSPVAHGVLAQNSIAQAFAPFTDEFPFVRVVGPSGLRDMSSFKGRTILMPLWAEWCAPCMSELPDFARLQQKYGNDKFAIIPIVTATQKKFTPQNLAPMMKVMHADVFEPLIEAGWGNKLLAAMGRTGRIVSLPCNLLIAPDGKVIAREIGRLEDTDDANPAQTRNDILSRVQNGDVQSRWGQQEGEQFAQAMANGFLA